MFAKILKFFIILTFLVTTALCVSAQTPKPDGDKNSDDDSVSKSFQETLVKQRIEREKKDYNEMLKRGIEALQISDQLEKSYTQNSRLSSEDIQKLDNLEKLLKKIRNELGADNDDSDVGDDDSTDNKTPAAKDQNAFQRLHSMTADLVDKLNETTRFSISVAAIQSSNALLNMVRLLKIRK